MKVGEFYMKHGMLVEITDVTDSGRAWVGYCGSDYPTALPTEPFPGGGGSGTWGPEDFKHVTDPLLLLRIELTKAHRESLRAVSQLRDARRRLRMLRYAIGVVIAAPSDTDAAIMEAGSDAAKTESA